MTTAQTAPGRHLIDGTVRLFLAEALAFPTGIVTAAFLTRSLHPAGYGLFTLAAVLISWLEWIVPALFSRAAVKFVSEASNWGDVATAVLRLYVASGFVLAAVVWILSGWIAHILGEPSLAGFLRLYTIEIPIFAASYAHRNILIGRGDYRHQSFVSASRWIARMALIVILVTSGFSVRGAVLGSIGGVLIELAAGRWFIQPRLFGHGGVSIRSICAFAAPLFAAALCTRLFERMDIFVLKSMGASAAQSGFYGAAQNIALAPSLFAASFTPLLLGTLTRVLRDGGHVKAIEIGSNAIRAVLCLAPFVAVAFGASGEIVRTVFGEAFASSSPLVGPLVTAALALVLSSAGSAMVIAAGRPSWTLYSTTPLPFLGAAGFFFAIPRMGAPGAAYVTMAVALCGAVLSLYQVHRLWQIHPSASTVVRSAAISAIAWMIAATWHTESVLFVVKLLLLAILIPTAFLVTGEFTWWPPAWLRVIGIER